MSFLKDRDQQGTNVHVKGFKVLLPPAIAMEELPSSDEIVAQVIEHRATLCDIVSGRDQRLAVVVGPCSIHDPDAALEYATKLKGLSDELSDDLFVVMRSYFEKPRSTVGWKGLINDPELHGTFDINRGIRLARKFLLDVATLGLPIGCEFLDPVTPQFISDLITWGAIGARTTESQPHRELASGLSMPVGFKNTTTGDVKAAVDAIGAADHPHRFLGATTQGLIAIVSTTGNSDCHVILRGGNDGPNYSSEHVADAVSLLEKAGRAPRVMIDCSHGNSRKDHNRQPDVAADVASQLSNGSPAILGVMLESFLVEGNQKLSDNLVRGQSITDACMGWEKTAEVLRLLAQGVKDRRGA